MTGFTIQDYQKRRQKYVTEQHEYRMMEIMDMPMTEEQRKKARRIQGNIDQCDMIMSYMKEQKEDTYKWPETVD
jgi:hypothetical protein